MSKSFLLLILICVESFVFAQNQDNQLYEEVIRFDNGKIKAIIGLNELDKREGITYEYYPNGLLFKETTYLNDIKEGLEITYFQNGRIASKGIFINGLAEGEFIHYYKNGTPFASLYFYHDLLITAKNCFTSKGEIAYCGLIKAGNGVFLKYDKKGKIISKDYYKNGKFVRTENVEILE